MVETMGNQELVDLLYEIADLLDIEGVKFKPEAYRKAARGVEAAGEDLRELLRTRRLQEIPGVGEAIAEKIREYLETGHMTYVEKLRQAYPPGLVEVVRIPGVGPKTAKLLFEQLGVATVEDLRRTAEDGRLLKVRGMGPKKAENILHGIGLVDETKGRMLLGLADPMAQEVVEYLRAHAPVERIEVAGSLRRRKETVGDVDILVTSRDQEKVVDAFVAMPGVREVILQGPTKATVRLTRGLQVDLRVMEDEIYGAGLLYFTGSKDHNIHLRTLAIRKGLKISEYGLFRGEDERIAGRTEEEMYAGLGLPYIEPEMRENTGEIEAALISKLPERLVTLGDIKGDLHVHTDATDGHDTLDAMVGAARAKGYEYVGISDHSRSLTFINGLSVERLLQHRDRIRALDRRGVGIRVLAGSECDIKDDGTLDYPDEVLKELDYVIASIHSKFTMPEAEMTARVVRAMENGYATILGHPQARLIGEREPIALDLEKVLEVAEATGTVLEVNSYYNRLDLPGPLVKMALEYNVKVVIDTDSHATQHLDMMKYGVGTARRGWAHPSQVLNTLSFEELRLALA